VSAPVDAARERTLGPAIAALVSPPRRARLIFAGVLAAAAYGLCWVIGMDTLHAAAVAVLVLAAGVAWVAVPEHLDARLVEEPPGRREGVRREVIDLSWSLRRQRGGIRENAFRRVRALASASLAERGMDLDDPDDAGRIAEAIGAGAYSVLAPQSGRFANLRAVTGCLDALERLDGDGP
jgi:hypothetical protein